MILRNDFINSEDYTHQQHMTEVHLCRKHFKFGLILNTKTEKVRNYCKDSLG